LKSIQDIEEARDYVRRGLVIAYPTEAVYGLGCDPFQEHAVRRILEIKQRLVGQGMIILIADWPQLSDLIDAIPEVAMNRVRASWPGGSTWVFPKSNIIPSWISGDRDSVAIRMTTHPVAMALCREGPVVSTSANLHGQPPARHVHELQLQFPDGIDGLVSGDLGQASQPSAIYDVLTGDRLR